MPGNKELRFLQNYRRSLGLTLSVVALILLYVPRMARAQCDGGGGCGTGETSGNVDPNCSPVIVDVGGGGFHLTSAADGVQFDITGSGRPIQIAWTAAGSANGFLVLDRNHDGAITSGKEMFGNFTPQPVSANPNGFLALAEFDKPQNGGNGDGVIDHNDVIFASLRIWIDKNHDGISQPDELFKLPDVGVYSISLDYKESGRTDAFGNRFRYRARVNLIPERIEGQTGASAYDVFLMAGDRK